MLVAVLPATPEVEAKRQADVERARQAPFAEEKVDQLQRLHRLHVEGALTDAEFEAEKRRVLIG